MVGRGASPVPPPKEGDTSRDEWERRYTNRRTGHALSLRGDVTRGRGDTKTKQKKRSGRKVSVLTV